MAPELNFDEISDFIENIPDDVIRRMQFSVPWQYASDATSVTSDPEDRPYQGGLEGEEGLLITREDLQRECWKKFNQNPQVNTAVRGLAGRIAGKGFETTS